MKSLDRIIVEINSEGAYAKAYFSKMCDLLIQDHHAKLDLFQLQQIPACLVKGGNPVSPNSPPFELIAALEQQFEFFPDPRLGNIDALIEDLNS